MKKDELPLTPIQLLPDANDPASEAFKYELTPVARNQVGNTVNQNTFEK